MLKHHPDGPFTELRRILRCCFHDSILSRIGVSGNPGAVQFNTSAPRQDFVGRRGEDAFPDELDELDEFDVSVRGDSKEPRLTAAKTPANAKTLVSLKNEDTASPKTKTQDINEAGLKRLREVLKLIAFHNSPMSFKVDVKIDYVWIRAMKSEHGEQRTIASTKAALSILDDAVKMERGAFRERLERFLRQNGFEI
jgi:hypothetical protein